MSTDGGTLKTDVLIIGGGLAGCMAAIKAADEGMNVLVLEKANTKRSGAAATGIDHFGHWNPEIHGRAGWTAEDMVREEILIGKESRELIEYTVQTSYERLCDLESFGVKFRFNRVYPWNYGVEPGEYEDGNKQVRMVPQFHSVPSSANFEGRSLKPKLTAQLKKRGVRILNRVMVTKILTQDGRVVGATGVNTRTGEFIAVSARSTVLATGGAMVCRLFGNMGGHFANTYWPLNVMGDGHMAAVRAGVEMLVKPPRYQGIALRQMNLKNFPRMSLVATTSYPAGRIVNAEGEVLVKHPWASPDPLRIEGGPEKLVADMKEGKWPLYVDLTQATEEEIEYVEWSMDNEGATWAGKRILEDFGIDLRTHKIELELRRPGFYHGYCGVFIDAECRSSLSNLYAAGDVILQGSGNSPGAVCLGWRAGETAASSAQETPEPTLDASELSKEKDRVFEPLQRDEGISWQEMNRIVNDIMDNYVAGHYVSVAMETQNDHALGIAVSRLIELREQPPIAKTTHELMRTLEVLNLMDLGEFMAAAYQEPRLADETCWFLGTRSDTDFHFRQNPKE